MERCGICLRCVCFDYWLILAFWQEISSKNGLTLKRLQNWTYQRMLPKFLMKYSTPSLILKLCSTLINFAFPKNTIPLLFIVQSIQHLTNANPPECLQSQNSPPYDNYILTQLVKAANTWRYLKGQVPVFMSTGDTDSCQIASCQPMWRIIGTSSGFCEMSRLHTEMLQAIWFVVWSSQSTHQEFIDHCQLTVWLSVRFTPTSPQFLLMEVWVSPPVVKSEIW